MDRKNWSLETVAVHGAYEPKNGEPQVVPICQSTTFRYETSEHLADLFDLKASGHFYTRLSNPTVDMYERKVAMIEGGAGAMATSSGQAATLLAVMNIAKAGDSILSSSNVYGGTHTLFQTTLRDMGIKTIFFDPDATAEEIEALAEPDTKGVFAETIANPSLVVADFEKLSGVSKRLSVPLIIDNTFATGVLCRPIDFGADIVVLSSSKYLDGHAAALGGIIVDSGTFNYANGKFPGFTEPDKSYHGVVYAKDFPDCPYILKARVTLMRNTGMVLSPSNAFLTSMGMETLHLRMERHSENAIKIAEYLENHENVLWVKYPGLKSSKYYGLSQKYLPKGASGVLSFGVTGGGDGAERLMNSLKLISVATHVSDVRSCALQPSRTTHRQLSEKQLKEAGVPGELIRLSVGIENVNDIIADLEEALKYAAPAAQFV